MPLSIADASLRNAYGKLSARKPSGLDDLLPLLATLTDRAGLTQTDGLTMLNEAVSRAQQLALVKEGLSANEHKDIEAILDDGTKKLTADARKFLEQLVGRTPQNPTSGAVQVSEFARAGAKQVTISGAATKDSTIEVINLSTIPTKRLHDDNTFALGKTGADGAFSAKMDARAGDWLRMRTRTNTGKESDWVLVRVEGAGTDTRNAEVNLLRMELTALPNGQVALANNNSSRPISEPFATLRFINERTKKVTDLKMDDTGRFPADSKLPGKEGDTYTVAATDGINNKNFKDVVGKVQVATEGGGGVLADPLPHKDDRKPDGSSRYSLGTFTGPLFKSGAKASDVMQGNIGNCYLPAAAAALAHVRPGLLEQNIRKPTPADRKQVNEDRKARGEPALPKDAKFYVVEFAHDRDGFYGKHLEAVDADFFVRGTGGPVYGAATGSQEPGSMELWWPLFEKAYAQLVGGKDGYQKVGSGGSSADVFMAMLGRDWLEDTIKPNNKDAIFRLAADKLKKNLPVAIGTYSDEKNPGRFANSGVYGDHAYSVLEAFEKGGVKYLKIRNPWAESEPHPGDGKDDGIFDIKLDDVPKYFNTFWSVE
jgi:Calpain family cysteine protease